MRTRIAVASIICTICLLYLILLLRAPDAQSQRPYAEVIICIYDFDAVNQRVTFNVNATAYQVNLTSRVIVGELDSPFMVKPFIMSEQYGLTQGVYQGGASDLQWPMYGRTQDYPYDSYSTNFTFAINSYTYRNGTTGRVIDFSSPPLYFCGPKAISLGDTWKLTSNPVSITRGNESSMGIEVQLQEKNTLGYQFIVPIWMIALFLGVCFFPDSRRMNLRLEICGVVIACVLAYLAWVSPRFPIGSLLYPPEIQAYVLFGAAGISALLSVIGPHFERVWKQAVVEGLVIISLTSGFVICSLLLSFPWVIVQANALSLAPFALTAITGIAWRLGTNRAFV